MRQALETFEPASSAEMEGLANDSTLGVGASLWTRDRARAERLAAQIEAGLVNELVRSSG